MVEYYTGVGDANTPLLVLSVMEEFAYMMADMGYVLRTGDTSVADRAFRKGCESWCDNNNVNYCDMESVILSEYDMIDLKDGECNEGFFLATEITKQHHPDYNTLSDVDRFKLEVTVPQLFSDNIDSTFVVCYGTDDYEGNTAQIERLAKDDIPIFNLKYKNKLKTVIKMIKEYYE